MASAPKQHLMTDGLILRDYDTATEADRFVAILTRDKGIVRASARGARRLNSRSGAATQPLCYSQLSLIPARGKYIIEDAKPREVFFKLREDVERMALAQYFCELALSLCPEDAPAEGHLRLMLGGLYFLSSKEKNPLLVKAVVEARLLSMEGYAPDLYGCVRCAKDGEPLWFSPSAGTLFCGEHVTAGDAMQITSGVLAALRHILNGTFERCFAFSLPIPEAAVLATLTERFLLAQVGKTYKTLDFFHTLREGN